MRIAFSSRSCFVYGVTVSVVVTVTPVSVAVIVTTVVDLTAVYVTGNVADFDPTGMLTVEGTETTDGFEL